MKNINKQLEEFRKKYSSINVMVYDDYVVYRTPPGFAKKAAVKANKVIEELKLELTAIPTNFQKDDSFVVKSSETIDI
jgi:hypothetical protein